MKKYIVPEVEYVIISTKEDILNGSNNEPPVFNDGYPEKYGSSFTI